MFERAAELADVPEGKIRSVELGGALIALCNVAGEISAVSDICTHDGAPLDQGELSGSPIVCPRHGARFDARSGRVLSPPATRKLRVYPVELRDGAIYVDATP
jgi:3-phenylpropionate/trans-cinnamate dioxygenase ferredoxin component